MSNLLSPHSTFSGNFLFIAIMDLLLIKYASKGRPKLFLQTLENITTTISTDNYQILVSLDKDDDATLSPEVLEKAYQYPNVKIKIGEPISKVSAINRDFEHAKEWTWLLNMSDDVKFVVNGWDELISNKIHLIWGNSTDYLAHFNDNFVGDKLPTVAIMGRDFYERFKYIYHNSYGSICCDAEQFFVSQMIGRYHYFPEVYFHHIHPANVPSIPVDQTYRNNDKFGKSDEANYFERMSHGFYVENPVYVPNEVKFYMDKRLQNESK